MELDAVDLALLRALRGDARASLRTLAKRLGVSTPTVSARLKSLESRGIVRGYSVRLDAARLGQETIAAVVEGSRAGISRLAKELTDRDDVREVHVTDRGALFLTATFPRHADGHRFIGWLREHPDVDRLDYHVLAEARKEEDRAVLVPGAKAFVSCEYCGRTIADDGVRFRIEGKPHVTCCRTCERELRRKHAALAEGDRAWRARRARA